jgi:acyl carrier protein
MHYFFVTSPTAFERVHRMLRPLTLEPETRIFEIVRRLLRERAIERTFTVDDNLRDIGLTSLDMTNLVLSVEGELSVRIPDNAITPANFTSVAAIGGLVAKLLNAETAPRSVAGC